MPIVFASDFYQVNNGENAFKLVQIIRCYRLCAGVPRPESYENKPNPPGIKIHCIMVAGNQSYNGASGMHLSHIELKVHNNST